MEAALEIVNAGIGNSLQSSPAVGMRDLGLTSGGPLDSWSLQRANLLVGNQRFAQCIEVLLAPLTLIANQNVRVAIVGYGFELRINNLATPINHNMQLSAGDKLELRNSAQSGVAYISLAGGMKLYTGEPSRQKSDTSNRLLNSGAQIAHEEFIPEAQVLTGKGIRPEGIDPTLRAIAGPETKILPAKIVEHFWQGEWQIARSRNRMGARLNSATEENHSGDSEIPSMLSHGVLPGTIQVTSAEQCIGLLADCQTTGGYPRVASIIEADLWKLAQLPVDSKVRFEHCSIEQAIKALQKKHHEINRLAIACNAPY